MARLYHHKTDGGAEYLCSQAVEGTDEGDLHYAVVRLDGEPEILDAYLELPNLVVALKELRLRTEQFIKGTIVTFPAALLPQIDALLNHIEPKGGP